jgi:hypothetical protein
VVRPGQGRKVVAAVTDPELWSSIHGKDSVVVGGLERNGFRKGHPGLVMGDLAAPSGILPASNKGLQLCVEQRGETGEAEIEVAGRGHGAGDRRVRGAAHLQEWQSRDLALMLAEEAGGQSRASQTDSLLVIRIGAVAILAVGGTHPEANNGVIGHGVALVAQNGASRLETIVRSEVALVLVVELVLGEPGLDPGLVHEAQTREDETEGFGGDECVDVHTGRVNAESGVREEGRPKRKDEDTKTQKKVVENRDLTQNVTTRIGRKLTVLVTKKVTAAHENRNCDLPATSCTPRLVDGTISPCTRCCPGSASDQENSSSLSECYEEAGNRALQRNHRVDNERHEHIYKSINRHTLSPGKEQGLGAIIGRREVLKIPGKKFIKVYRKGYSKKAKDRSSKVEALIPLTRVSGAGDGLSLAIGRANGVTNVVSPGQGTRPKIATAAAPNNWRRVHGSDPVVERNFEQESLRACQPSLVRSDLGAPVRIHPARDESLQLCIELVGEVGEAEGAVAEVGYGPGDGRVRSTAHPGEGQSRVPAFVEADAAGALRGASQADSRHEIRDIRLLAGGSHLSPMAKSAQSRPGLDKPAVLMEVVLVLVVKLGLGGPGSDPGRGHEGDARDEESGERCGNADVDVHGRVNGAEGGAKAGSGLRQRGCPQREGERNKAQKGVVETRNLTQNASNRTVSELTALLTGNPAAARESHGHDLPEDTIPDRDGTARVGRGAKLEEARRGKTRPGRLIAVRKGEQTRVDGGTHRGRRIRSRSGRVTTTQ